jgi:hypothetical protein
MLLTLHRINYFPAENKGICKAFKTKHLTSHTPPSSIVHPFSDILFLTRCQGKDTIFVLGAYNYQDAYKGVGGFELPFLRGENNMWKTTMLTVAASFGLLVTAGCDWMTTLYVAGAAGGSLFLSDYVLSLFGL